MSLRRYERKNPLSIVDSQTGSMSSNTSFVPNNSGNDQYFKLPKLTKEQVESDIRTKYPSIAGLAPYKRDILPTPRMILNRVEREQFAKNETDPSVYDFFRGEAIDKMRNKEEQEVLLLLSKAQQQSKMILEYMIRNGLNVTEAEKQKMLNNVNEALMYRTNLFFKPALKDKVVDNLGRETQQELTKMIQGDIPDQLRDITKNLSTMEKNIFEAVKEQLPSIYEEMNKQVQEGGAGEFIPPAQPADTPTREDTQPATAQPDIIENETEQTQQETKTAEEKKQEEDAKDISQEEIPSRSRTVSEGARGSARDPPTRPRGRNRIGTLQLSNLGTVEVFKGKRGGLYYYNLNGIRTQVLKQYEDRIRRY